MAVLCEEVGFDSVWLSEHHGAADNYLASPFTLAAAIAQATSKITIGMSIALAPFYDPTRLAEDSATVDCLSDGRFELGLGMGYRDDEFERFNVPRDERLPRLIDAVEVCKRAWTGEPFDYDGECFEYEDLLVTPQPVQGTDLRLVLGALAEPAVRRAARISDGVIGIWFMSRDHIRQIQQWAADETGGESFRTHLFREAFVADSEQEAWDVYGEGIYYANKQYYDAFQACSDDADFPYPEEELLRDWGMFGDPESVADQILAFDDLLDDEDHMILRLESPGSPHEAVMESIRRTGNEVFPRVRE